MAGPGVLSTGGNIVFSSESSGHVIGLDAVNGKKLWDFGTGQSIWASPVTYSVGARQFVSVVAGPDLLTFGLHTTAR